VGVSWSIPEDSRRPLRSGWLKTTPDFPGPRVNETRESERDCEAVSWGQGVGTRSLGCVHARGKQGSGPNWVPAAQLGFFIFFFLFFLPFSSFSNSI
jgi:hypothetical protein